jgi:hypothetical protein
MACSQTFSVEKNQQRRALTVLLCWFFIKLVRRFSPFYSEKSDTSYQTVYYWAYKKETCHLLRFLIKVLSPVFPLISSALGKNTLMIYR